MRGSGGGGWRNSNLINSHCKIKESLPRTPHPTTTIGKLNYPLDPRPHPQEKFSWSAHVKINLDSIGVSFILYYIAVVQLLYIYGGEFCYTIAGSLLSLSLTCAFVHTTSCIRKTILKQQYRLRRGKSDMAHYSITQIAHGDP